MDFREIKINDLSKELNIPSKTLIEKCNEIGIEAKNFMKVLSVEEVKKLHSYISMGVDKAADTSAQSKDKAPASKQSVKPQTKQAEGDVDQSGKRHRPSSRGEYTQVTTPQKKTRDVKPGSEVRSATPAAKPQYQPKADGQRPYGNRDGQGGFKPREGGFNRDGQKPYGSWPLWVH